MKRFFFILFALTIAWMSWEGQLATANVKDSGPIPQESIRLRILANSDSPVDQWLKRKVRDTILAEMNTWAVDIASYDEAGQVVAKRLPELRNVVNQTIQQYGFTYQAEVDFGQVDFPTKLYGSYIYPAGKYEALRVRIGEAKGQNWWCVLFPPLCFIDIANGDAVPTPVESRKKGQQAQTNKLPSTSFKFSSKQVEAEETRQPGLIEKGAQEGDSVPRGSSPNQVAPSAPDTTVSDVEKYTSKSETETSVEQPKVEVRSFFWDKLVALFS